jgi:hypothetical protein
VVVASAFNYPHGIMDPVPELAALAAEHGAGCHVDACIGGFVRPDRRDTRRLDFRAGRHAISRRTSTLHAESASVILHRDEDWFAAGVRVRQLAVRRVARRRRAPAAPVATA